MMQKRSGKCGGNRASNEMWGERSDLQASGFVDDDRQVMRNHFPWEKFSTGELGLPRGGFPFWSRCEDQHHRSRCPRFWFGGNFPEGVKVGPTQICLVAGVRVPIAKIGQPTPGVPVALGNSLQMELLVGYESVVLVNSLWTRAQETGYHRGIVVFRPVAEQNPTRFIGSATCRLVCQA